MKLVLTQAEIDRFWSKVQIGAPDECWPWLNEVNNRGYGRFPVTRDGRRVRLLAHRVAFELSTGAEIGKPVLLHRCDNPPCCNPGDLRPGTQVDNMRDAVLKHRASKPPLLRGTSNPHALLDESAVRTIWGLLVAGETSTAIARMFNVDPSTIGMIKQRRNWRHVTKDLPPVPLKRRAARARSRMA